MKDALRKYIDENLIITDSFIQSNVMFDLEECLFEEKAASPIFFGERLKKSRSQSDISTFIEQAEQYSDFQTLLFKMIDDRDLKDSDVYNKVHIDRRLFSKISASFSVFVRI